MSENNKLVIRSNTIPKDANLLVSIGRITTAHANLELEIKRLIAVLLDTHVMGIFKITKNMGINDLRNKALTLADGKVAVAHLEKLKEYIKTFSKLSEDRNKYIHRAWSAIGDDIHQIDENYEWGPPPTSEQINNTADKLLVLSEKLRDLRMLILLDFIETERLEKQRDNLNNILASRSRIKAK